MGGSGLGGSFRSGGVTGGGAAFRGTGGTVGSFRSGGFTPGAPGNWRGGRGRWGYGGGWGWGYGVGLGYWGLNPYWYGGFPFWYDTLGYGAYVNPYYTNMADYGGYDYGVPIQQSQNPNPNQGPEDNDYFAQARAAFYAGNYPESLRNIEHAAIDMPTSQDVHQFHALVFFALGDYSKAAAVAHTVLDTGPGWNWSVLQSFYPSPDVYTQQLRNLEHSISEHGDQAALRFLLGYEYLMLGHFQAAHRQFEKVVALEPRDTLAKNILNGVRTAPGVKTDALRPSGGGQPVGAPTGASQPGGQPVITPQTNVIPQTSGPPKDLPQDAPQGLGQPSTANTRGPTPVDPGPAPAGPGPTVGNAGTSAIVGNWKSSPEPGVTVEARFQPDKHFTWKFTEGGQGTTFTGTYVQQGDDLILTRDQDGQKMEGTVTTNDKGGFKFRLKNADPNDLGLQFSK
jgi:hypothetical protein